MLCTWNYGSSGYCNPRRGRLVTIASVGRVDRSILDRLPPDPAIYFLLTKTDHGDLLDIPDFVTYT